MRVAVIGATGAVGAAVVEALRFDPHKRVDSVIGLARRLPLDLQPHVDWHAVDLTTTDLAPHLRGVDAIVSAVRARSTAPTDERGAPDDAALARRVLETAATAGVYHVVQLSSFLCYSPATEPGGIVDETWPVDGLAQAPAVARAVELERVLDGFNEKYEVVRLVRIRSGVVLGPRVRNQILARTGVFSGLIRALDHVPIVPSIGGRGVPAVHHDDLAAAIRAAVTGPAFGPYNLALDQPLRSADIAAVLGARPVAVSEGLIRKGAALADRALERVPRSGSWTASGWVDVVTKAPRLDARRARSGLEWAPRYPLRDALRSTIAGP